MEATLAPVDAPLIEALALDRPVRIAEVGSGGGGTTLEIFRRAPSGSVVHGFDLSSTLVEHARSRKLAEARAAEFQALDFQALDFQAIDFQVANMENTAPPAQLYDRLASRFGVMFFENPAAAFDNLRGWLAPGGRFAFAVWGDLNDNPWLLDVREIVAGVVSLPEIDFDAPGPFRYADSDKFLRVLESAGFRDLAVTDWRGALPIGGGLLADDAAGFALAAFSSFRESLEEAGGEAFDKARTALTARYRRDHQDGRVTGNACVHVVTGTR